jgi:hypothetical protein
VSYFGVPGFVVHKLKEPWLRAPFFEREDPGDVAKQSNDLGSASGRFEYE